MQIKGIVAGIGDKASNQNVITPDFDANIVGFMVGGSAIVKGLDYVYAGNNQKIVKATTTNTAIKVTLVGGTTQTLYRTNNIEIDIGKNATQVEISSFLETKNSVTYNPETGIAICQLWGLKGNTIVSAVLSWQTSGSTTLKRGVVVHRGYRGELVEDISGISESKVYAQYVLKNNENDVDEFYIETTNGELPAEETVGSQKTYNLLLYDNGIRNADLYDMPATAYHSLTCDTVLAGGTIDSEVTGFTQAVNNNSLKIATTQYVENQIEEEIDYGHIEMDLHFVGDWTDGLGKEYTIAHIEMQRKAKQVIAKVSLTDGADWAHNPNATVEETYITVEKIPSEYRPKSNQSIILPYETKIGTTVGTTNHIWLGLFLSDGKCFFIPKNKDLSLSVTNIEYNIPFTIIAGWETN